MATSKTTLDKNISMGRTATTATAVPDKNISMGMSNSQDASIAEEMINPPSPDDTDQTAPAQK